MKRREERRDRTYRAAERVQREHLAIVHPNGVVDCLCEQSALYFAKRKALGCNCRRRRRGAPKTGTGICRGFDYRPALIERIRWRERWHALRSGADPEGLPTW